MTTTPPTTPLEAALAYAARGFLVFPSHGIRANLECTCGESDCRRIGKHWCAAAPRGPLDATTSESRIKNWWRNDAPWNVSLRTGRASNLYVLDVGPRSVERFKTLYETKLPATPYTNTPTGGHHVLFAYPSTGRWPNQRGALDCGVDTRGEGGWIVAPPSAHAQGVYAWGNDVDLAPAAMPPWLLQALRPGLVDDAAPVMASHDLADALGDESATAPVIDVPDEAQWRPDPYTVAGRDVAGADVRPALESYARELAHRGVNSRTVVSLVRKANDHNCRPPLSTAEADDVAYAALANEYKATVAKNDSASRAPVDSATAAGQRQMLANENKSVEAGATAAVTACLLSALSVIDYDDTAKDLSISWHDTREVLRISLAGSERELQPGVITLLGDLSLFAAKSHPKAKPKHVISVLREFARAAPSRQVEQEDSEPVALVDAINTTMVWKEEPGSNGYDRKTSAMLAARTGFHKEMGLGFMVDERGRRILVVNFSSLAGGVMSRNAQFRGKSARELKALFRQAPGYMGDKPLKLREVRNAMGDLAFYGLDMDEFARAVGRRLVVDGKEADEGRVEVVEVVPEVAVRRETGFRFGERGEA